MFEFIFWVYIILGVFITLNWYSKYCPANFKFLRCLIIGFGWPLILVFLILWAIYEIIVQGYKNERY